MWDCLKICWENHDICHICRHWPNFQTKPMLVLTHWKRIPHPLVGQKAQLLLSPSAGIECVNPRPTQLWKGWLFSGVLYLEINENDENIMVESLSQIHLPPPWPFSDPSSEAAAAEVGAVSRCCLICSNSAVVAVVVFLLHWAALVVSLSNLGLGQNWLVDN